jgi:ABC-type nitrate/sulfonate/bicarbonate transport systems, periplasmic components
VNTAPLAWVNGSDAPEKPSLNIGYMALTDCASVVVAATQGFAQQHGLTLNLKRQGSWAGLRDKLASGELDAAHCLYGLVYAVHLGIGGVPATNLAVLMGLNQNAQAINLSPALQRKGVTSPEALAQQVHQHGARLTFAQTFPTGTHAMWLYYWLASAGINPLTDIRSVVVPPPQMVMNMKIGNMVGYCVGEPWNQRAISDNIGFTAATSQQIWPDHPEKVLGTREAWVNSNPNTARALTAAVLEAARWIDASEANRRETAQVIAGRAWINTKEETIVGRMLGQYQNGIGQSWQDDHAMRFFHDGEVSFPWLSDGMWFMTQHKRWGLLKQEPDYLAVARQVNRIDIYKQAATQVGNIAIPDSEMRSSVLIDGKRWDGSNPAAYANSFSVKQ